METDYHNKDTKLLFFGKITASVTHELNNVMSIMNELTGLLEDMLYSSQQGGGFDSNKLQRLHDKLQAQIMRGQSVIKQLNRFAHTVDAPVSQFDANALIGNIVDLSMRFARNKRLSLSFQPSSEPIVVQNKPYDLLICVFSCLSLFFENSPEGSSVTVSILNTDNKTSIEISRDGATSLAENMPTIETIREMLAMLGCSLQPNFGSQQMAVTIVLSDYIVEDN